MSNPRLSIIPAGAVTDRSLEPRDLQVLCLLGRHTDDGGWCRRSQVKMARELDCGRASLQRSLDRLAEAGWVEKKRPPWSNTEGQPSASYLYRVILDRDDAPPIAAEEPENEDAESYAETASEEGGCPPVGTPASSEGGAQPDGHPGAHAYAGTRAQPYAGTKNDPLERPPVERERDARAKDRNAKFLAAFEQRWPTAAADDRQRTAYAAGGLSDAEQEAALAGIGPFLDYLKRQGRKNVPAGWRYLEEKRWELLEQAKATGTAAVATVYAADSTEAKAVRALHDIAARASAFWSIWRRADGTVSFPKPMTPQFAALAGLPAPADWVKLDRKQAGAWNGFLGEFFEAGTVRKTYREGDTAPWAWPPSVEGKLYTTGPPETLMSEQDLNEDWK